MVRVFFDSPSISFEGFNGDINDTGFKLLFENLKGLYQNYLVLLYYVCIFVLNVVVSPLTIVFSIPYVYN